ncbi:unnamed protein product [Parnassius mnemosyne]|uniref:ATP-dependent DNA helicase n=1 Tax=Parnassius mnemosyne TaxID=213953 RepID=A0AAV1KMJ9_9NEOP
MWSQLGRGNTDFPKKLLLIGNGKVPESTEKNNIDKDLGEIVTNTEDLISRKKYQWMWERAVLTVKNTSVDAINDKIMAKLPGDNINYLAIDTVVDQEDAVHYPQEFLNSLNPYGLPPHELKK